MTTRILVIFILLPLIACTKQPANPSFDQVDSDRLQWFKEAKFGMFIHWGPYSNLAGEWNGRQVPVGENAEWIMQKLQIPREIYRELAHDFNPVKFDANAWVDLAKNTGMQYLVITSKHHDGFAMYKSQVSDYNIVDWTPFDRDPLKLLAEECRKSDIRFCVYYSHREDWDEPQAYGNTWDFDFDPEQNLDQFEQYLEAKAKPQVRELINNYGPLGLIWFDRGLYTQEEAYEFLNMARELQPNIIINGRVGSYNQELVGDYQNMNDNGMPIGGIEEYWESPQTLNETWGYSKFDHEWKSAKEVIHRLVAIVSQGGNYLLNVGPTGEGVIPEISVRILEEVGEWMNTNGESIYGTTASPFPQLAWGWCTLKGQKLYLHMLNRPNDNTLRLPGMHNTVNRAYYLADQSVQLKIQRSGDDILIPLDPNQNLYDANDTVIVMEIVGAPEVDPLIVPQSENGGIELDYVTARTDGKTVKRFNRKGTFHISKMQGPEDTISWFLNVTKPGDFDINITYAAGANWQGQDFSIVVNGNEVPAEVKDTGDWYEYQSFTIGQTTLPKGQHELIIRPQRSSSKYLMYFKGIHLTPK